MIRWGRFAAAYALLAVFASVVGGFFHGSAMVHSEPWLLLDARASHTYSLIFGAAFGGLIVVSTRVMVARFSWARNLHRELRPIARGMSLTGIACLALMSALGEELLFRGLLQPWLGVVGQAVLFGLAHQIRGPSRWVWVAWATLVGLALGAMFQLTGSLVGPIVAHAVVNCLNLLYLKTHDPEPKPRALGGLLGERP